MAMDRHENGDSLSWHYLDSVQKEFGPFTQATMRDWFNQGFFPNGEELMIRLPHWKHHLALKMVWPDVSQAFMGLPQGLPQPSPFQTTQVGVAAREGFDQYPAAADLQASFAASRPEEQPSYLGDAAIGGFWNRSDPSALRNGTGYPHGMPLPDNSALPCGPCGMMPGAVSNELLDRMPSGVLPNLAAQSDLAGMGHLAAMSGLPNTSGMPGPMAEGQHDVMSHLDGRGHFAGFAGIMLPMQQALSQVGTANAMQFVPMQMPGARPTGRFRGRIKSFNAKQGFGFIENPEAYAMFGRDVFLHKAQIGNLKVGMEVTYGVEMNKFGMPQARDLATLDGKPPGPPPASVAKGGTKTKASGKRFSKGKEEAPRAAKVPQVPQVPQAAAVSPP